jgi:L-rhamnose mutarotase
MRHAIKLTVLLMFLVSMMQVAGCSNPEVKRVGMVIRLKPEKMALYKEVHADSNPGVRDIITTANMRNFSIFMHQLDDGNYYLFGYYEYIGDDFEADMAKMNSHPDVVEWLEMTDPCQIPIQNRTADEQTWATMEQVYLNE